MECYDVIVSLASNDQQDKNLPEARERLGQILSDIHYTKELQTKPFSDSHSTKLYVNQLAYAKTTLSAGQLNEVLKDIEKQLGRTPEQKRLGIVCIDLDLMEHDGTRYHLTDWERPYIKQLIGQASDECQYQ